MLKAPPISWTHACKGLSRNLGVDYCSQCNLWRPGSENEVRAKRLLGIGDLTSTEKGTAARANGGKPDLSLIPLSVIAQVVNDCNVVYVLRDLGEFQRSHDVAFLLTAIRDLGSGVWPECAQVFEYGKVKYAAWNWAKGMPWSAVIASAARHLLAMCQGESIDPESELPHRGHVMCNLVMLITYTTTYPAGNDLPEKGLI